MPASDWRRVAAGRLRYGARTSATRSTTRKWWCRRTRSRRVRAATASRFARTSSGRRDSMKGKGKSKGAAKADAAAQSAPQASVVESLKFRRKELGLTLHEVARRSGLSPAFISLAERHKAVPSIVSLIALAKAL